MQSILKYIETVLIALVVFLAPLKAIATAIIVLVLLDMCFGVAGAHKSGQPIESNKLKRTVSKLLIYYSATIVGFIAGTYLINELLPIEKMITTLIGVVEVKSILENLDIIYGGDFFKSLLDKLNKPDDN